MILNKSLKDGVCILDFEGILDRSSVKACQEFLHLALKEEPVKRFIFNLTLTKSLDSSGLGFLVAVQKTIQSASFDLRICGLNSAVSQLLSLTKVNKILNEPLAKLRIKYLFLMI